MKKSIKNIVNHAEVSEKAIEAYLAEQAREHGLLCLKYTNANATGYPDRLVCLPNSQVIWVELKSKGRKPTRLQLARHEQLAGLGHKVIVMDCKEDVDAFMDAYALLSLYNKQRP